MIIYMVALSHWIFLVACFYFCFCPALHWLSVIRFWYFLWFIMIFKYFSSPFQSDGCPLHLGSSSANLMSLVDTSLPRSREHWYPGQWPLERPHPFSFLLSFYLFFFLLFFFFILSHFHLLSSTHPPTPVATDG